jgi:2-polyprenyl-3-methyl-5-hydroxy-6-metoxy-1,4-benzoquinol methylase
VLNSLPCKVCGMESRHVFSLEQGAEPALALHLCPGCGLLFVGNAPSEEKLAEMYSCPEAPDYYALVATDNHKNNLKAAEDVESLLRKGNFQTPSVCDVGCGIGQFLATLRERNSGLDLVGSELSRTRAAVARSKGFEVFERGISDQKDRFAVITMLDVAEHVKDPVGIFAECHGSLLPGGSLYVHTPCRCFWDSLALFLISVPGLRKLGRKWLKTRVSVAHLQLWTHKSLRLAYEKTGFHLSGFKRELELSWPVDKYIAVFLNRNSKMPSFLVSIATFLADLFLIRLHVLKNKAVTVAQKS